MRLGPLRSCTLCSTTQMQSVLCEGRRTLWALRKKRGRQRQRCHQESRRQSQRRLQPVCLKSIQWNTEPVLTSTPHAGAAADVSLHLSGLGMAFVRPSMGTLGHKKEKETEDMHEATTHEEIHADTAHETTTYEATSSPPPHVPEALTSEDAGATDTPSTLGPPRATTP